MVKFEKDRAPLLKVSSGRKMYLKDDGVAVFRLETLHEVVLVSCLPLRDVQKHIVDLHHFAKVLFTIKF